MSRFRNRDRSNRPGRGQIEHNVLEGLPINQYREIEITVGPNAADSKPVDVNAWPELPMPRDSHMLPEHSQQLLRAARSGRTIKPPAPPEEDDNEMKEEETEHKEVSAGFTIKKYVKVARHNEAPEPEFLAKRRKGLPSQYINGQVQAPLRETKVKKLDAEGNVAVYKVLAPEGQTVEGEVAPTDAAIEVAPVVAAPGTVVEGVGVVNAEGIVVANDILQQTPPRRRPPPPKKKKQKHILRVGAGRGRKRVDFVEGAEGQETPAPMAGSDIPAIRDLKAEDGDSLEPSDRDTPMGEAGEDDDSGEEGSEDDDQDQEDGTPASPSHAPTAPLSAPVVEMTDAPEIVTPTEPIIVTEASTTIPLETLQPPPETEQPIPTLAAETETLTADAPTADAPTTEAPAAALRQPSSPDLSPSAVNNSEQPSISQLPTSTTVEPDVPEPVASGPVTSEPISAPVPSTEIESIPASVDVPKDESALVESSASIPISKPDSEPIKEPSQEQPSVPPSAGTPDLLGSLEAELDKKE